MEDSKIHIMIKKMLFAFIIFLLVLPLVQRKIDLLEIKPLQGDYSVPSNPYFSLNNWFSDEYQLKQQDYFNKSIGFRGFFVRLYNQIYYSAFNTARAKDVVVGREDYLYEYNYIRAYLGRDFIGKEKIREKVSKLKIVRDSLYAKGIDIVVILAPGKGSIYNEYIPAKYNPQKKTITNYEVYRDELNKSDIHFLDLNKWFLDINDTSRYPLFPKTGIHWSKYGETIAADTILNYIASIRKINMAKIVVDHIETPDTVRSTDDDIEKGMNLLFDIEDLKMAYPSFSIVKDNNTTNPKVLTVADSYYWGLFNFGLSKKAFNNGKFWFYNQQIYPDSYHKSKKVADVNIKKEVQKNDVIILMLTEANLFRFAFGFIDQLYDAYINYDIEKIKTEKEARIQAYIHAIKETPEWFKNIKEQAKKQNITLEEALRKNANYMVWKEDNE